MANIMALIVARHEHFPHVRMEGWKGGDRPVGFTATQSHYSISRGAMVAGMGMNQMKGVASDRMTGAMIPEALDQAIVQAKKNGETPFFVNSTMGTTVMGGYDNSHAISEVCKRHGLWHHMDACWGGLFAFSDGTRHMFDGSHLADSVSLCLHKGLGVPQQCSFLITNNKPKALEKSNSSGATYLFHDTEYSQFDLSDKTLSCARHADSLKVWLHFKRQGLRGLAKQADEVMEKSIKLTQLVEEQPDKFQMVNKPMGNNICFFYHPEAYRNGSEYSDDHKKMVHKELFERMQKEGSILIQHQPLEEFNLPNFIRVVFRAEKTRIDDLPYILDEIDRLGKDINFK